MENTEVTQATDAPEFDESLLSRMVGEVADRVLEQEAPAKEERSDPRLDAVDKPKVTGERVPQWERRAFRALHGVLKSQSKDHGAKIQGYKALHEYDRQQRSITAWQRDEEDALVNEIIADSQLSRRVQKRLHSTLTGPAGEFALPKPFLAELFVFIEEYGLARRLARRINMTSKDLDLKSISTKPVAVWTGESVLLTEDDLALAEEKLTTNKLGAVTSITKETEEDAFVSLLPSWLELLGESIAQKEDEAWLRGDGTSDFGLFTGISNLASAQVTTLGAGDLNFSDVVEADLRTTRETLSPVRRRGARWVMHRGLWNEIEQFESGGGDRIVQPRLTEQAPDMLLNFPVELSEAMVDATTDVASVDFAILGNFSRSLMGVARNIVVESSDTAVLSDGDGVVTFNAFQQDGILLKISTRVGFQTPSAMQDGFAVMNAPAV